MLTYFLGRPKKKKNLFDVFICISFKFFISFLFYQLLQRIYQKKVLLIIFIIFSVISTKHLNFYFVKCISNASHSLHKRNIYIQILLIKWIFIKRNKTKKLKRKTRKWINNNRKKNILDPFYGFYTINLPANQPAYQKTTIKKNG